MYLPTTPAFGYPDDGEERPPFVLIEPYAYFADRDNATTAICDDLDGKFKVTFCTARPPLVSYMCFHATGCGHTSFAVEPQILATETDGSRVLLRVVFGNRPSAIMFPHNREYFVYDARCPSLKRLPHPGSFQFGDDSLAFVRKCTHGASHDCSNCGYVLAAHSGGFEYPEPFELYLYDSDSGKWGIKPVVLEENPSSDQVPYHCSCKAITIGGHQGTVAWVDLWHNIVRCDVLAELPVLRSLELPPPILLYNEVRGGNPRSLRDIALLDGSFKYVQIQPGSRAATLGYWQWEVTVWSIKISSSSAEDWKAEYKLKSSEIEIPQASLQINAGIPQPTLSTLHVGLPNLSLQEDGIVYLLSKVNHCDNDHVAWVLAVDMRNKTIKKVEEFNPSRTLGLAKGYSASSISKFLKGKTSHPYSRVYV
ncbi:unnamed protein product [Alopecurus aequalis]